MALGDGTVVEVRLGCGRDGAGRAGLGVARDGIRRGHRHPCRLAGALDRYAATRVGTIGLVLRDNRDGGYFAWRPRTLQSYSTIKVLILVATLKRAQDRHLALTSTQKSLASRMIRTPTTRPPTPCSRRSGCRPASGWPTSSA